MRMTARMLATLPFTAGPANLRFHPLFSSTVLVASTSGLFSLVDAQGGGRYLQSYQVRGRVEGVSQRVEIRGDFQLTNLLN